MRFKPRRLLQLAFQNRTVLSEIFFAQRATVPNVAIRSGVFICPWWRQHPISADLLRQCLKGELEHDNLSTRPH